jgi:hypothetical protein
MNAFVDGLLGGSIHRLGFREALVALGLGSLESIVLISGRPVHPFTIDAREAGLTSHAFVYCP